MTQVDSGRLRRRRGGHVNEMQWGSINFLRQEEWYIVESGRQQKSEKRNAC